MALQLDTLRRTALILVFAGLLWNLVEAGVGFWAGAQAGSVALIAFGFDSIVELLAGGILIGAYAQTRMYTTKGPQSERRSDSSA